MYYCMKCKKAHQTLPSAEQCCNLHMRPCLECQAKNMCQNFDSSNKGLNAVLKGEVAGQRNVPKIWAQRACYGGKTRGREPMSTQQILAEIDRLQDMLPEES
jgi:hypothetical protein